MAPPNRTGYHVRGCALIVNACPEAHPIAPSPKAANESAAGTQPPAPVRRTALGLSRHRRNHPRAPDRIPQDGEVSRAAIEPSGVCLMPRSRAGDGCRESCGPTCRHQLRLTDVLVGQTGVLHQGACARAAQEGAVDAAYGRNQTGPYRVPRLRMQGLRSLAPDIAGKAVTSIDNERTRLAGPPRQQIVTRVHVDVCCLTWPLTPRPGSPLSRRIDATARNAAQAAP